ncbi:glycoside hydrolase family 88 protein [Paenibacillus radicis (ex Xue et al. 2023)]|uniref:Glycoside hydrolase family 88 protein n=1 Tax=Paenibacillus radicis (ex Xue et al. 2023) TaxID=2972489 RepID=A0ABT1YIH1_9BACL|nr:glycoside hydrolase family 88 protein [Paenibacillus radicis (ex Xue et al. 2023)]MCR8632971.1 glycoside hydrolase family 88 protein [Paenibacillus radicis (ex Xue et al. 2023)]
MSEVWIEEAWNNITGKIGLTSPLIGSGFPHASIDGRYDSTEPNKWTSGFWPGLLWLMYRDNGNESLRQLAEKCEMKLDTAIDEFEKLHHDVGFMWCLSSVANYKVTGNEQSRKRALKVASWLAGRFNIKGKFIRAWNGKDWGGLEENTGWAIIDCTMNLSLLFWASEVTGDPRFRHIAMEHADTVLREFLRPDGSVHHIVCFDSETGERKDALGGQGFSPQSAWARGIAWAVYGLAICYSYTKEVRYLHGSQRAAHFFLANLPEDLVPPWDFRLPELEGAPRDSSAAVIAAGGMLLLSEQLPTEYAVMYQSSAERILKSITNHYTVWDLQNEAIVMHATGSYPTGKNIDVPLIYGDYFYVEALAKLRGQTGMFW